jgi:hypothetical protein
MAHLPLKYDPPTFTNHATTRRPDVKTPTAFLWHVRLACACKEVMQRTQRNVLGMNVQQQSWEQLDSLLPCSSCIAGKMRKTNRGLPVDYSDVKVLAVSRTPATQIQSNRRNETVSVDWAIVNKENLVDVYNIFALFYDHNVGLVHVDFQPSRGQAGEALENYIRRWGIPETIHHDNAQEFLHGKFETVCKTHNIRQTQSAPYSPNQNPAERYMEIIASGARSLLYTSGLPADFGALGGT